MRLYAGVACLFLCAALSAGEHDKKAEPVPDRGPASVRAEVGIHSRTASDSVMDELQTSLDDLYTVTNGEPAKPVETGEVKRVQPQTFWSFPK